MNIRRIVVLLIIFILPIVSAYQEKFAIKECTLSFNDNTFGVWNESLQKGVFLKFFNNNLNIGPSENCNFTYISYQKKRQYYNNFETTANISTIPILQLKGANEDKVYANCTYKVGDSRIFFQNFNVPTGKVGSVYLTSDFNITQDIMGYQKAEPVEKTWVHGFLIWWTNGQSKVMNFNMSLRTIGPKIGFVNQSITYFADNTIDSFSGNANDFLREKGFYPNTEPTTYSYWSIKDSVSGLFADSPLVVENGNNHMIFNGWAIWGQTVVFYINSTTISQTDITDNLGPQLKFVNITDLNKSSQQVYSGFIFSKGDYINTTVEIINPYLIDLNNISIQNLLIKWPMYGIGFDYPKKTDVVDGAYFPYETKEVNVSASSSIKLSFISNITKSPLYAQYFLDTYMQITKNGKPMPSDFYGMPIGTDNIHYLGISSIDPRIGLSVGGEPSFSITLSLYATNNLNAGEYGLIVEVYNSTYTINANKVNNYTIVLDQLRQNYSYYTLDLPMDQAIYKPSTDYYIDITTVKLAGDPSELIGKRIAKLTTLPSFKSGPVQYYPLDPEGRRGDTFYFTNGETLSRDTKPIRLFNPDFYYHNLNVEIIEKTDSKNFTFSLPNVFVVQLKPLETRDIDLMITANYTIWPKDEHIETFKVRVTSNQTGIPATILPYYLNVSKVYWLNLKALSVRPESVEVVEGKKIKVDANWTIQSSEAAFDELKNKPYNVKIDLIKGNEIRDTKTETRTITNSWITEYFQTEISVQEAGNYTLKLSVDSDDRIVENVSTRLRAENDNNISFATLTVKDADANISWCSKRFNKDKSQITCQIGSSDCWVAKVQPITEKKNGTSTCCGDDGNDECWLDNNSKSCCKSTMLGKVAYIDDPDDSTGYCNLMSMRKYGSSIGDCDSADNSKSYCWNQENLCCGNDLNETWSYYTSTTITNILVTGTCYNSAWYNRQKGMYYQLKVKVI